MAEIDFITAFGRLLRDGKLRDLFAINTESAASQIGLREADRAAWRQLVPADIEFQAAVLLRKRLDVVKFFIPETCRRLGEKLWPFFNDYARIHWPGEAQSKIHDAFQFCQHLKRQKPEAIAAAEWHRLHFALSKQRFALHWVEQSSRRGTLRSGFQIMLRGRGGRWREFFFYLGL